MSVPILNMVLLAVAKERPLLFSPCFIFLYEASSIKSRLLALYLKIERAVISVTSFLSYELGSFTGSLSAGADGSSILFVTWPCAATIFFAHSVSSAIALNSSREH